MWNSIKKKWEVFIELPEFYGYFNYEIGIYIFYNFYKAFQSFVETEFNGKYDNEDWYIKFKKELSKLKKVYDKLIKEGKIDENGMNIN